MSALIPYAASELAPTAQQLGFALGTQLGTAGVSAAKKMFAKRANAGRTKKRKHFKTEELGRPAGHQEAKRNNAESPPTSISNKEMELRALITVEKDVAANENISKRQRDTILHKGVKVCFTCKNIRTEPVFLNWAIVIPKANVTVLSSDILRGDDQERYLPVDQNQSFLDLRCAPINTDRYNVLKHKRMLIKPDSDKATGAGNNAKGSDLVIIEEYIKTNRQIFFNGDTAAPITNMFMIWWVDYYGSPTGSKTLTADVSWKLINYFKEI